MQMMIKSASSRPDVDVVLAARDQDLLKLPGVAGIYVCILGH